MPTTQGRVDKGEDGDTFDKAISESAKTASNASFIVPANARRAVDTSLDQTPHPNNNGAAIVLFHGDPEIVLEQITAMDDRSIANRYHAATIHIHVLVDD